MIVSQHVAKPSIEAHDIASMRAAYTGLEIELKTQQLIQESSVDFALDKGSPNAGDRTK